MSRQSAAAGSRPAVCRRLVLVGMLVAFFALWLAPAASAAPAPDPAPAAAPAGGNDDAKARPKTGSDGILQPFDVTDREGIPISSYTIQMDTGGWKDIDLKLWNIIAQLFFGIAKWVIGFTCWVIDWALDFGLAEVLVGPVENISNTIKHQLIDRLGLPGLFLLFAGVYTGYLILFKERSRGFAEIGISLVVAAVTTTVLVSPAQVLLGQHDQAQPQGSTMLLSEEGLLGKAKDFTLEIASIVLSEDPANEQGTANPDTVAKPITNALVEAFIVKPNQLMIYGRTFDGGCDKAFREYKLVEFKLSQTGMNYWEAYEMDTMYDTKFIDSLNNAYKDFQVACQQDNPEAKRASADVAFSALFIAIAALIVAVLLVLVAGGFLTAQGWLAFEAIRGHWALCAGILPGGGRATLWRWLSAITKAVLGIILAILFLAIFILIVLALIKADTGDVLAVKFIVLDVTAIAGLAGHKKIRATATNIATNLNRRLANARTGGSRRSVFNSPGRYAETAPGLKQMWGEARGQARQVTQPVGKGLKTARNAWVGSPEANRKAGRLRSAARLATTAATTAATGGTAAAAKVAAQKAAKQGLQKRLATAAANKMSQTRGGRATMKTGKAAVATAKYGAKAGKFAFLASPVGAPVGIPRGIAATKRGKAASVARAKQVRSQLSAVHQRTTGKKLSEANAFRKEYGRNVATAARFVAKTGTKAQVNLGLAPIQPNPQASAPPGPRAGAIAQKVPGTKTPSVIKAPAPGPTAVPKMPTAPTPAPAVPAPGKKAATPPSAPRSIRRATRPAGPPKKTP